jgi:dihydroneopterin aldolase
VVDGRVTLRGLALRGRHGVADGERRTAQEFVVDIECPADVARAAASDDIADTVDYTRLSAIAEAVIGGPSRHLVETLADEIARRIVAECGVPWATVTVEKVRPEGVPGAAAVAVTRGVAAPIATIELHVPDFEPVRRFYGALGFIVERDEPGADGYLVLRHGDARVAFWPGSPRVWEHSYFDRFPRETPRGYGVEVVLAVHDLDPLHARASELGCVVSPLERRHWGPRDFRIADPYGYYIRFTEAVG